MADVEAQPRRAGGGVALAFAIAALAASWNPIAAPFGLLVGVVAALLGARALRRAGGRRAVPAAALAMGVVAALASVVVLLLTAGAVGVELPGEPVVKGRTQAELDDLLSKAGERTRGQRERARKELDRLAPAPMPGVQGMPAGDGGDAGGERR
jgi:hypothetical protein